MIVTCEGCETNFQVEDLRIRPTGSKVRCSKCRHVFVAYPKAAGELEKTLILQEEVPGGAVSENTAGLSGIDARLHELLREDAAEQKDVPLIDLEPEYLNVDDLLAEETPASGELTAEALGDDLKLDLDLGLILEETSGEGAAEPKTVPPGADFSSEKTTIDFSLDAEPVVAAAPKEPLPAGHALDLHLDDQSLLDEAAKPAAADAAAPADRQGTVLDLDLDFEALASKDADAVQAAGADTDRRAALGPAATGGKATAASPVGALDEEELELDLNLNETTLHPRAEAKPLPAGEDELDLSDLEAMLEGVEKDEVSASAATEATDLLLDLGTVGVDETKRDEMPELDLTAIASPAEKSIAAVDAAADDLDFSDLTGILDEKAHAADAAGTKEAAGQLELAFGDQPQAESADNEKKASSSTQDELMLDLEKLLEEDEEKKAAFQKAEAKEADEADLEFAAETTRDPDGELEIEIEPVIGSDVDRPLAAAATAAAAASAAAMAAGSLPASAAVDAPATDELSQAGMTGTTETLDTEAVTPAASQERKEGTPERSGWMRNLLLAAGVLIVLALAALVLPRSLGIQVPYLSDVEIPFLGKIFQAEPEDTVGNLKVTPVSESVNAEFTDSVVAGRLCVIKGQVRNNYDQPRSFIRITAKLYDKSKTVVKTTTVFAGNVLSKEELASQGFSAISARLSNKNGANNLNVGLKPGAAIPFMVVFDRLPDNLDEYSVEVAGSSK